MGVIRDAANAVLADGPTSSPSEPQKPEFRALFATIEDLISSAANGVQGAKTWVALSAVTTKPVNTLGQVSGPDTGTHTDPVTGALVSNVGNYIYTASGWQWTSELASTTSVNTLGSVSGTSTVYAAARDRVALAAYVSRQLFSFVPNLTSGSTPTLSVDGLAATTIKDANGNDLIDGDLVGGRAYVLQYHTVGSAHFRVVSGRLGSWSDTKLPNLFSNGALDASGLTPTWLGSVSATPRLYRASIGAADAALSAYGIKQQLNLPAESTGSNNGSQLIENVVLFSGAVFFSQLVELVSGDWPTDPTLASVTYTDGTSGNLRMATYADLGGSLRRYYTTIAIPAGKIVKQIGLGLVLAPPRTCALAAGGFWASHLARGGTALISDTAWPNWNAATTAPRSDMVADLAALKAKSTLRQLKEALLDDLHSITMCLVGDSLTWGMSASNISATDPRSHSLSDPRNTVDVSSPSWVNLMRDFLSRAFVPGSMQTGDAGVGYHRYIAIMDPSDDPRFTLTYKDSYVPVAKTVTVAASATFGHYMNVSAGEPVMMEFYFTGDDITLVYSRNDATAALSVAVQIDDGAPTTYALGLDGPVAFKAEKQISTTFGTHRVRIWPTSTQPLRVEGVKHNRRLLVRNQGIIGTATSEWLPAGALYPGVMTEDEFVIIMLGTNDNDTAGSSYAAKTRSNLVTIVNALKAAGKVPILMTPPPEYDAGQVYPTSMTAQAIARAATDTGISLIDNFRAFMALPDATLTATYMVADQVHLSDIGHQVLFRNIVHALADVLPAGTA